MEARKDSREMFMRCNKMFFSVANVMWNTTAWKHWGHSSSFPWHPLANVCETHLASKPRICCAVWCWQAAPLSLFCSGGLFRMLKKYKVSQENHAKSAGVVKVDWHIFWQGKRIPWQSLKPAGLISQNSAACVLVWLPLAKSHWLIPCQLCEWARVSIFIESLG